VNPGAGQGDVTVSSPLVVDSYGMWSFAASSADQVLDAAKAAMQIAPLPALGPVDNVVVLGTGVSALAGSVVAAYAAPVVGVPVIACNGYELPMFVGERSLVFAISRSGDTEETLRLTQAALDSGAAVVVVSSGGTLTMRARAVGALVVPVAPSAAYQRGALGALAIPPLILLERFDLMAGVNSTVGAVAAQLSARAAELAGGGGIARSIARRIGRTIPLVQGVSGLGAIAATYWKAQVNTNAKAPAFSSSFPELCHDEVVGWGQHGDITRQVVSVVILTLSTDPPGARRSVAAEIELLDEVVGDVIEVSAQGDNALAQFFDVAMIGDFVSLHLAAHEGVDPGPTPVQAQFATAPSPA
jgi:glucose/mannose-6-phosphate isomerase